MARFGEERCADRFEEGPIDDCCFAIDCSANLCERSSYRFVNTADRTGHPGRRRTGHNRRLLYIGHRGIGHDHRPVSFSCPCGSGRRRDDNLRHGADDPVTVVARYPDFGRIVTRPDRSMYS